MPYFSNSFEFGTFFQNMALYVMDHYNHVIALIPHWIDLGHRYQKMICIRGWQNNTKNEKSLPTKKMQNALLYVHF